MSLNEWDSTNLIDLFLLRFHAYIGLKARKCSQEVEPVRDVSYMNRNSTAHTGQKPFSHGLYPNLRGVKHVVAIGSGKGGVGKSSVSSNLAVALRSRGAEVGLMDADIYGPSQPGMLGAKGARPGIMDNRLLPISRHGVRFISMGSLMDDNGPVIWRAPMAMKMIQQFITSVVWGDLDYLLIDLPPGTGDVRSRTRRGGIPGTCSRRSANAPCRSGDTG